MEENMGKVVQGFLRGVIQAGMYLAYRPKVIYKNREVAELMKDDAPVVFICNHMSHNDGALIASVLHKKKPYFLIAKDWYDKKQFGVFLKAYGSVPVDRSGMDTGWYDACRKLLEAGHSILIFPEGNTPPAFLQRLGAVLPYAVIGLLVVYCLKDVPGSHWKGLPELIAIGAIVLLHKWKKNTLLSIAGGTVLYMMLVQTIFV